MDGGVLIGSGTVASGVAQATTLSLPAGVHSIRAVYGGGGGYASSESAAASYSTPTVPGFGFLPPLTNTATSEAATGDQLGAVAFGDFNGDGKVDLAVTETDYGTNPPSSTLAILLGNGDGTFQAPSFYPVGSQPENIVVADFNGDGNADLAVGGDPVTILLGNGRGYFQAVSNPFAAGSASGGLLEVGDFNRDGKADLIFSTIQDVVVLPGNGDGTFGTQIVTVAGANADLGAGFVADFNGDGKPDFATVNFSSISVFLGAG